MMNILYELVFPLFILVLTVRADCDSTPTISNASNNITGSPPFPEGAVARYDCDIGYNPRGGTSRYYTCTNTDWVGSFECDAIYCSYVAPPDNGYVANTPTNEIGTTINFACDIGHDMIGYDVLLCRSDGEWSPTTPPTCNAKDCGEFGSIQFASLFQDNSLTERNHYGSVVDVTCLNGRVLNGPPRVTCEANGQWGDRPTCELLDCPPYPNTNSQCLSDSQVMGDFYFILCKENISTRVGPNAAECISGSWDSLELACYCDCEISILNTDFISISNLNNHGNLPHDSTLQWTCYQGYSPLHVDTVICTDGRLAAIKDGVEVVRTNSSVTADVNQSVISELCTSSTTNSASTNSKNGGTVTKSKSETEKRMNSAKSFVTCTSSLSLWIVLFYYLFNIVL